MFGCFRTPDSSWACLESSFSFSLLFFIAFSFLRCCTKINFIVHDAWMRVEEGHIKDAHLSSSPKFRRTCIRYRASDFMFGNQWVTHVSLPFQTSSIASQDKDTESNGTRDDKR